MHDNAQISQLARRLDSIENLLKLVSDMQDEHDEILSRNARTQEHHHQMLHAIGDCLAGISHHLSHPSGMSSEETAAVIARLKSHAEKLEAITTPPKP